MTDAIVLASGEIRRGHAKRDRVFFALPSVLLCLAVILGGATAVGRGSDEILEIVSIPVLVAGLSRLSHISWSRQWRLPLLLVLLALILPLVQLIPLPPGLWSILPGRHEVIEVLEASGVATGWRPISLAPHATIFAFLSMLPAAAIFVAVLQLPTDRRLAILAPLLTIGALSALFGAAQSVALDPSELSVQAQSNIGYAIGFFANRNHFAALIYSLLPFAFVWTIQSLRSGSRRARSLLAPLGFGVIICLLAGLAASYSRAGVALGVVALLGSSFIIWRSSAPSRFGRWAIIVAGIAIFVVAGVFQLGLLDLVIERSVIDDTRSQVARDTLAAIGNFSYAGSGFGTFVPVYRMFEQSQDMLRYFANHAHNDWLEIVLESGVLGGALLIVFVCWLLSRLWAVWVSTSGPLSLEARLLGSAAGLSVVFLLVHSLVDYPLRTTTLMTIFAMGCAFLCPAPDITPSRSERERRRPGSGQGASR